MVSNGFSAQDPQDTGDLRSAAESGDPRAQYRLGMRFANGDGLPLNYVEAARWIRAAADQGHPRAQATLGWLFANGFGVEQDDPEAGRWYLAAAGRGLASAQYTAAVMYRWGRYGVSRDAAEMLRWYQAAADQGLAAAQYALGQLLAAGGQVPADPLTAFQWLSLAILNGSEGAKRALADLSARLTPEQIEAAKQQVMNRHREVRDAH